VVPEENCNIYHPTQKIQNCLYFCHSCDLQNKKKIRIVFFFTLLSFRCNSLGIKFISRRPYTKKPIVIKTNTIEKKDSQMAFKTKVSSRIGLNIKTGTRVTLTT
jgi:hypothetical protein